MLDYCSYMGKYKRHEEFLVAFGNHLRDTRKKYGVTQENLAYSCELQLSQIGRIERGETNTGISMIYTIANALDIHHKELFDFDFEGEQ